jgi:hypothetical protein
MRTTGYCQRGPRRALFDVDGTCVLALLSNYVPIIWNCICTLRVYRTCSYRGYLVIGPEPLNEYGDRDRRCGTVIRRAWGLLAQHLG